MAGSAAYPATMRKPKSVTVGELTATPHRPPTDTKPLWSWRCRKAGAAVWSGRARRADVAAILMAIIQTPPDEPAEPSPVETVGQAMALWLSSEVEGSTRAPLTVRNYRSSAGAVSRVAGALRLDRGPWTAREAWRLLSESGLAHRTVQIHTGVMLMAWRWAHGYGFVATACPAALRVKPPPAVRRHTPTLDDALRAIETVGPHERGVLLVQLATGARISEVCLLHAGDVRDEGGRIVVTFGLHEYARKTGRRDVPVTMPAAVDALRRALVTMRERGRDEGVIWTSYKGRPVSKTYRFQVGKALRDVDWTGLGVERFASHGLRRLAAKMLRQAGVPLEVVAGLLGHSIVMMLKVYREVDEGERFDAMDRARLGEGGGLRSIR